MLHIIDLLVGTVALRPYVFVFFGAYLLLSITQIGYRRTLFYAVVAYLIAFLSEWSSAVAGTGIPFGFYRYIESTRAQELWILGVPFMDSLSFTFLSYVSWEMAILILKPGVGRNAVATSLFASFLMMFLDIIIDPVALLGDRWFLGKIYEYPNGGAYFGVTIMNFAGWFVVCFLIIRCYIILEKLIFGGPKEVRTNPGRLRMLFREYGTICLYLGVLGFNLFITFWIGEMRLGLIGVFLTLALVILVMMFKARLSTGATGGI
jgi:uncharacterized membrane protein